VAPLIEQNDLFGKPVKPQDPAKPWSGICCKACWAARSKRCRCRCGGVHHGSGSGISASNDPGTHFDPAAQLYEALITKNECLCGQPLIGVKIAHYDHDAGWPVEGRAEKQWLYKTCPACGHERALNYLGVDRSATITKGLKLWYGGVAK